MRSSHASAQWSSTSQPRLATPALGAPGVSLDYGSWRAPGSQMAVLVDAGSARSRRPGWMPSSSPSRSSGATPNTGVSGLQGGRAARSSGTLRIPVECLQSPARSDLPDRNSLFHGGARCAAHRDNPILRHPGVEAATLAPFRPRRPPWRFAVVGSREVRAAWRRRFSSFVPRFHHGDAVQREASARCSAARARPRRPGRSRPVPRLSIEDVCRSSSGRTPAA